MACLTPIEYGGRISETLAIGALASRYPNQKLEWNADQMKFVGKPDADKYLTRVYRDGWQVKGL